MEFNGKNKLETLTSFSQWHFGFRMTWKWGFPTHIWVGEYWGFVWKHKRIIHDPMWRQKHRVLNKHGLRALSIPSSHR